MTKATDSPLVFVIFGITGDLAKRKLLPALYSLFASDHLPEDFRVVGVSRQKHEVSNLFKNFGTFYSGEVNPEALEDLQNRFSIETLDMTNQDSFIDLRAKLEQIADSMPGSNRIYYLSIPAQAFVEVISNLGQTGHGEKFGSEALAPRLLVEKPFGYNLQSAKVLIGATEAHFTEDQIYRIDHYLAKETAQNILTFRFNNSLFENIWNAKHIDRIKITAHESIGIEGRAHFYEQTGALRDLIQSHLTQMLALVTMEEPRQFDSASIHKSKLRLLESIDPITSNEVSNRAMRGQYNNYRQEVDNDQSYTETFARTLLTIDNEKWRGTEFILETGKGLSHRDSQITVHFRDKTGSSTANTLIFRVQPNEGISLTLQAKKPGLDNKSEAVVMDFDYDRSFGETSSEAYQRVIIDAVKGDQSLFLSSREVIASWQIFENVISEWSNSGEGLVFYDAGADPQKM